jgi:hypothetical protein
MKKTIVKLPNHNDECNCMLFPTLIDTDWYTRADMEKIKDCKEYCDRMIGVSFQYKNPVCCKGFEDWDRLKIKYKNSIFALKLSQVPPNYWMIHALSVISCESCWRGLELWNGLSSDHIEIDSLQVHGGDTLCAQCSDYLYDLMS